MDSAMGMVVYLFVAISAVMIVGWAVYVLPTPGPLSIWQLTGAFWPAVLMLAGAIGTLVVFLLIGRTLYFAFGIVRNWWQR